MGFKSKLAGIAIAAGAAVLPMTTKANSENSTNTIDKISVTEEVKKVGIPAWIPVDKKGNFDRDKAEAQASLLWKNHGKEIKQFAADIKKGVPEDVAFSQFAHRLAAGDKEKEQQVLSFFDSVKKVYKQRNGKMDDKLREKYRGTLFAATMLAVLGLIGGAMGGAEASGASFGDIFIGTTALMICTAVVSLPIETVCNLFDKFDNVGPKEAFVQVQEAAYNFYSQQKDLKNNYTTVDMQTAKKMIKMDQKIINSKTSDSR